MNDIAKKIRVFAMVNLFIALPQRHRAMFLEVYGISTVGTDSDFCVALLSLPTTDWDTLELELELQNHRWEAEKGEIFREVYERLGK